MTESSDSTLIYIGDFVKTNNTSDANGTPICTKAAVSDPIRGIVMGFEPLHTDPIESSVYRRAGEVRNAIICDDPYIQFSIQVNGTLTVNDFGKNADIVLGSPSNITGMSGTEINLTTLVTTSAQLKILTIEETVDNEMGANARVIAMIQDHELQHSSSTIGVDIWDRTGTTITPDNAGDDLDMGTGDVSATNGNFSGKLTVTGLIDPTALILDPQAVVPATDNGTIYYDSVTKVFNFRENGAWVVLADDVWQLEVNGSSPALTPDITYQGLVIGDNTAGGANAINNFGCTILGGSGNVLNGLNGIVLSGHDCTIGGDNSTVGGNRAKAVHSGCFIWADAVAADFSSTTTSQVMFRATSGFGINTAPSADTALDISGVYNGSVIGALLIPRLTSTERNTLSPVNSMRIFNTTTQSHQSYSAAAGGWIDMIAASGFFPFIGTIAGVTPTAAAHLGTKGYIDTGMASFGFDFFFNNTVSDIGGIYHDMTDADLGGIESEITTSGLGVGPDQPIGNFATLSGSPGVTTFNEGLYEAHLHIARTDGTRTVNVYFEVYRYEVDTTETLLATSEISGDITTKESVSLHANIPSDVETNAADRLIIKFLANVTGGGANVDITLYQEGDSSSRIEFPTTTEILNDKTGESVLKS